MDYLFAAKTFPSPENDERGEHLMTFFQQLQRMGHCVQVLTNETLRSAGRSPLVEGIGGGIRVFSLREEYAVNADPDLLDRLAVDLCRTRGIDVTTVFSDAGPALRRIALGCARLKRAPAIIAVSDGLDGTDGTPVPELLDGADALLLSAYGGEPTATGDAEVVVILPGVDYRHVAEEDLVGELPRRIEEEAFEYERLSARLIDRKKAERSGGAPGRADDTAPSR